MRWNLFVSIWVIALGATACGKPTMSDQIKGVWQVDSIVGDRIVKNPESDTVQIVVEFEDKKLRIFQNGPIRRAPISWTISDSVLRTKSEHSSEYLYFTIQHLDQYYLIIRQDTINLTQHLHRLEDWNWDEAMEKNEQRAAKRLETRTSNAK